MIDWQKHMGRCYDDDTEILVEITKEEYEWAMVHPYPDLVEKNITTLPQTWIEQDLWRGLCYRMGWGKYYICHRVSAKVLDINL